METIDTIALPLLGTQISIGDVNAIKRIITDFSSANTQPHPKLDYKKLAEQKSQISFLLSYYSTQLSQINPAMFKFLNDERKEKLKRQLLLSFYLYYAQYQLDERESRYYRLKEYNEKLKHCAYLIGRLEQTAEEISTPLAPEIQESENYLKYLGLRLGRWLKEKVMEFSSGKTTTLKDWIGQLNGKRLYWAWAGNFERTLLGTLPEDFFNTLEAQTISSSPAPFTGYLSFLLYYTRFALNLGLLMKHTFRGPWMSEEERKSSENTTIWQRFTTQWSQRKFTLLNDSVWGVVNMVTFFWLVGDGMLGYYGNIVSLVFYTMDFAIAVWRFWEESTKHKKNMQLIDKQLEELRATKAQLEQRDETSFHEDYQDKGAVLKEISDQIEALEKMKAKTLSDWKFQRLSLVNDGVYAMALVIGFFIMISFLFPPAAMPVLATMILGIAGATLCFLANTAYAAINGGIAIHKSRHELAELKKEYEQLLEKFNAIVLDPNDPEFETKNNLKKQLYLELQRVEANSDYQRKLIRYQAVSLARSVFIEAFFPALLFTATVFLPFAGALGTLGAGFGLAVLSNILLKRFEPAGASLPEFDEQKYQAFCEEQDVIVVNGDELEFETESSLCKTAKEDEVSTVEVEDDAPLITRSQRKAAARATFFPPMAANAARSTTTRDLYLGEDVALAYT